MKIIAFCLLLLAHPIFVKGKDIPYAKVDKYAASIGYMSSDSLAQKLTRPFITDSEKVRSIFYWITQHISYDVISYHHPVDIDYSTIVDSVRNFEAAYNALYAENVLKKRMGVCSGYAGLFKLLCDKAGINSVIINGWAKTCVESIGASFRENHAWNAVEVNGEWKLLDACWASGQCDRAVTKFTRKYQDFYFFTPPDMFVLNHYPSDSSSLFTKKTISKEEFSNYPLPYIPKTHLVIDSFTPAKGNIEAKIGDTLQFELTLNEGIDNFNIMYGSYIAEFTATGGIIKSFSRLGKSQHFKCKGNRIFYDYEVWTDKVADLYLLYNNKYLLSYRLAVKK